MIKMQDHEQERWEHWISGPYKPVTSGRQGSVPPPDVRAAHALEYIASQMWEIRSMLDRLIKEREKPGI